VNHVLNREGFAVQETDWLGHRPKLTG
jgi:hypothetical protein